MTEERERLNHLEMRIERILDELNYDRRFDPESPRHSPRSIWRQFYISPKQILIWITFLNIVLFLGGTIFTGIQVSSIQDRYNEATAQINEARQKYSEAKLTLDSVEQFEATVKSRLDQIARDGESTFRNLENDSHRHGERMSVLVDEAGKQYELLVKKRADITDRMSIYLDDTNSQLEQLASRLSLKLQNDIEIQSSTISLLHNDTATISKKAEGVREKISKLNKDINLELISITKIKAELQKELEQLKGKDIITLSLFWKATDIWVKLALFAVPLLMFIAGFVARR